MKKLSLFLALALLGVWIFGSLEYPKDFRQKRPVKLKKYQSPQQLLDKSWRVPRRIRLDRNPPNTNSNNDLWAWVLGDIYDDYFESLKATKDGGCVFMGTEFFQNIWFVKLSSEGDLTMQKLFGSHDSESGNNGSDLNPIIQTNDGGFAFVITSYAGVGADICFVKTSPELDVITTQYLFGKEWPEGSVPEGQKNDYGYAVGEVENGDIFVVGITHYYNDLGDIVVFKISLSENRILWQKILRTDGVDEPAGVIPTKNGGCYVYGSSNSFNDPHGDGWITKFSPEGVCEGKDGWQRAFGGTGGDRVYAALPRENEGLTLAGTTISSNSGDIDFWMLDISPNGDIETGKQIAIGGNKNDVVYSIDKASNGDLILGGSTLSSGNGGQDFLVIRVSPALKIRWAKTYGGRKNDYAKSIQEAEDGNLYVAGPTNSFGYIEWRREYQALKDVLFLKLSSAGETNVPDLSHNMNVMVTDTYAVAYDTWATLTDFDIVLRNAFGSLSDHNTTPLPVNVSTLYPPVNVEVELNEDKTLFKTNTYFNLRWDKNTLNKNLDVVKYRVYKKSPDENTFTYLDEVLSNTALTWSNSFEYEGILQESAEGISFAVTALDSSGRESEFSVAGDLSKGK